MNYGVIFKDSNIFDSRGPRQVRQGAAERQVRLRDGQGLRGAWQQQQQLQQPTTAFDLGEQFAPGQLGHHSGLHDQRRFALSERLIISGKDLP